MAIYKWPIAAVKEGERIINNFLWSGDPVKKKFLTIKWAKVCKHPSEGGIGIKSLKDINIAMLMKLGWAFLSDHEPWAKFLQAKFQNKEGLLTQYYKNSSIWTGLKEAIVTVNAHSKWINGSGKNTDFWRDCWGSDSAIYDLLEIPDDNGSTVRQSLAKSCIITLGLLLLKLWNCWVVLEVKINYGAAAIGATGKAGVGAAVRNHFGYVLDVLNKGLGNTTLSFSECEAILGAIDWAVQNNWNKIWTELDSQTAISNFIKNHVPWPQRARWNRMKTSFEQIRFYHCWKVANFSAYQAAKRGFLSRLETWKLSSEDLTS
ncbi:hypothetical protein GIB67_021223 [Kingdonia uniflora]|uniref:RNase H type-1 domain-containing protein n=1 Tax=Kingdonia uniflora TaxID=39325 RepID=A0A7J7LFJ6_9MAGN|nr:hypothetical protein GIB67_021223 [Kingdonia uniflora]